MCPVEGPDPSEDTSILRSEPEPPERSGPGGVMHLTGTTVREAVISSNKNVLVMFHAAYCSHCHEAMPALEAVAAHFAADEGVVIAKMEISANTVPEPFEVGTVPTIYMKPESGFAFKYRGLRTTQAMIELVERHRD